MSDGATLQAGPPVCCEGTPPPGGSDFAPLALLPVCKQYLVSTGRQQVQLNAPSAPQAMPGLGTGSTVQAAHTLYLRASAPVSVVVTYSGVSSPTPQKVYGLMIIEADPSNPITGLAIQGSGALEWAAFGNS